MICPPNVTRDLSGLIGTSGKRVWMRRTEVLQGIRLMKFEEIYGRTRCRASNQAEAASNTRRRAGTGSSSVDVTVPREGDYEVCLQIPSPDMLYQRYLAVAAQTAKEY